MSATSIEFQLSLYEISAIAEAVEAYGQLAGFLVEEHEDKVIVTVTDPHPEVPDLVDHFANHVLWSSITTARRSEEAAQ